MEKSLDLHREFVRLGREKYRLTNRLLLILPNIYESGIYKKYATDIYEYAGRFGGISKSAVDKRLRLEKHLEGKPCLRAAIEKVGVNKVALMATLATPTADAMVADKVLNMNKSALQTLSKELRHKNDRIDSDDKNNRELFLNDINPCQAAPQTMTIELDGEMTFLFLKFKKKFKGLSNEEAMRKLLEVVEGRDCESGLAEKMEETDTRMRVQEPSLRSGSGGGPSFADGHCGPVVTGDRTAATEESGGLPVFAFASGFEPGKRYIKAAEKHEVLCKSKGRCQYPSCNKPSELFHHPNRYSITKNHKNLVDLCKDHHQFMHN